MEKHELEEIAKIVIEKDLFVVTDEIYSELTYQRKHATIAAFPGMKERTVLINGFLQVLCYDRMASWLCGSTKLDLKADVKDPSVRYHVCTYHQPVCSSFCTEKW